MKRKEEKDDASQVTVRVNAYTHDSCQVDAMQWETEEGKRRGKIFTCIYELPAESPAPVLAAFLLRFRFQFLCPLSPAPLDGPLIE